MCGIFAYIGKRTDAPEIVFEGLKLSNIVAIDSWGISYIDKQVLK